eukprot:3018487-Pyramimonas_sp.AAC.1
MCIRDRARSTLLTGGVRGRATDEQEEEGTMEHVFSSCFAMVAAAGSGRSHPHPGKERHDPC